MIVEDLRKLYECMGGTEDISKLNKFETLKKICELKGLDVSFCQNINELLKVWEQNQ